MFVDQIVVHPSPDNTAEFSQSGDSGSAIVTEHNEVAGLLMAGAPKVSWANAIKLVFAALANAQDANGNTVGALTLIV